MIRIRPVLPIFRMLAKLCDTGHDWSIRDTDRQQVYQQQDRDK